MNNAPDNKNDMARSIADAMNAKTPHTTPANGELIALVAEGRISELSEAQRSELLSQIASDSESGEILAELLDMHLDEDAENDHQYADINTNDALSQSSKTIKFSQATRRIFSAWAVAACLLIGLSLWTTFEPDGQQPGGNNNIKVYSNDNPETNYWDQLDSKRISSSRNIDSLNARDWALIGITVVCIFLSISLLISLSRDKRAEYSRPKRNM